jgi:hypothetical protein
MPVCRATSETDAGSFSCMKLLRRESPVVSVRLPAASGLRDAGRPGKDFLRFFKALRAGILSIPASHNA